MSPGDDLMGYTRTAYNGVNLMQIFAANSIMQRRLTPEAEILMMTMPMKAKLLKTSPFGLAVIAFTSFFVMITVLPLVLHITYVMAKQRETKMQQTLIANGLNPIIHFLSWLIHYTVINLVLSLFFVICLKISLFKEDSFALLFTLVFLAYESLFGLVFALQPFFNSGKMAVFVTTFFFFLSYLATELIDQKEPVIEYSFQRMVCLSPLTAIKKTFDTFASFYYIDWPMTFDNYDTVKDEFSVKSGMNIFIFNFFLYLAIGIVLEIVVNFDRCFKHYFIRKVLFFNTNENVLEVKGLKEKTVF